MEEVANIENNCISLRTKRRYHTTACLFIIWAYYNHRGILRPEFSEQVDAVLLVPRSGLAQRKALRTLVLTEWLDKMERRRPELCPVDVLLLSYDIVSTYMTTKKRDEGRYLGRGSYDNIRSSIIYLFTMSNTSPPPGFQNSMTTLLKGFTHTIVGQRVEAGESLEEGKEVTSFECLSYYARNFSKVKMMNTIFRTCSFF